MKYSIKALITITFTVAFLWGGPSSSFAQRDIGVGIVGATRDVVPVLVRSQSLEALAILRTAFSIHGQYRVVASMQEASFAIQVDPVGTTHSVLRISSGVPEQVQYTTNLAGKSTRNSILKAVDEAIRKTSGSRGFFAGTIAYVGENGGMMEIYARDFLFGEGLKLTSNRVEAVRPRWSPDGNYIVYTSYVSGFPQIHRIDLSRQATKALTRFKGMNTSARYSPDGSRLAMVLTGPGNADIYVGNSEAKALDRIFDSRGVDSAPCWSPDGRQIVFASDIRGGVLLFQGSSFGGRFSQIPTQISGYCAEPDWNPVDPDQIAFTAGVGNGFQIAMYRFSQRKSEFLSNESGHAIQPCWLNDGRHMLYTWRNGNSDRIVLFDTVSKKRSVLSPASVGKVSQPSFLPPR